MTSDKKNISLLADIFIRKGLEHIVISPGSRNAPIILTFARRPEIQAISIVDERSAAFFALGMAQQSGKAVAIACTSGSAALNYAPAIAEAYYQKIPLLVLTADRPPELITNGDGQTIRQKDVFANYIKKSYQLEEHLDTEADVDQAIQLINEAIHHCGFPESGPVHINLPFAEPLYNLTKDGLSGKLIDYPLEKKEIDFEALADLFQASQKVLVVAGQLLPQTELNRQLSLLVDFQKVTMLTETTSNLHHPAFIDCIDNVVSTFDEKEAENYQPDLIISMGGQVVSKMIKKFLRKTKTAAHWHISASGEEMDTYFHLTHSLACEPAAFFGSLIPKLIKQEADFSALWQSRRDHIRQFRDSYLNNLKYCDLQVFDTLLNQFPASSIIHLGNSTPVRYSQLFGTRSDLVYHSNRGVSGIDGQLSTAAGAAYINPATHFVVTGDLGFFYDSNALMNHHLHSNLKIIVINNGGGGIFRFIDGPAATQELEEFFEARHDWKAEHIAKAFNIPYQKAENLSELKAILPDFMHKTSGRPVLLEVFTPAETNALVLRDYFKFLKTQIAAALE